MKFIFLQVALISGLVGLFASKSQAAFVVDNLTGIFVDPAGGKNQGVGTSFFSTGEPFGAGGSRNRIEFTPLPELVFPSASFYLPSEPIKVGTFSFFNGVTAIGSDTPSVGVRITGNATITSVFPSIIRPVGGGLRIGLDITPNTTGNPFTDGDFWTFPKIGRVPIPENANVTVNAYARLVPQNFSSPPKNFLFEFTELVPTDSRIKIIPAVPTPSLGLTFLIGSGISYIKKRRLS